MKKISLLTLLLCVWQTTLPNSTHSTSSKTHQKKHGANPKPSTHIKQKPQINVVPVTPDTSSATLKKTASAMINPQRNVSKKNPQIASVTPSNSDETSQSTKHKHKKHKKSKNKKNCKKHKKTTRAESMIMKEREIK